MANLTLAQLDGVPVKRARGQFGGVSLGTWLGVLLFAVASVVGILVLLVPSMQSLWTDQSLRSTFLAPASAGHPLGTDSLGRDMFWRLLAGLGVSVFVGVGVAIISITLGLIVGILGGFFGRAADLTTNVVIDVTWAFPAILLAVVFAGWLGPGLPAVILALALTGWASFARIVRGEVLTLRERDYIAASKVLGRSRLWISVRHLVPNLLPLTFVMSVFFIATAIVAEAGLAFLGLGAQPPIPSLGAILAQGRDYLTTTWWPIVLAGGLLTLLVLLLNSVSDQLRDHFDPRHRGS